MNKKWLWMAAALMIVALGATLYPKLNPKSGELATLQLSTIDAKPISFAQWQKEGKVTVVNFWATDCSTCKKEMPRLVQMYQTYQPQGLAYVGIAMQHDNPAYIKNYIAAQNLPFNIAWDNDGELSKKFGNIMGTPTTFIIDKQGNIVKKYVGEPQWDEFYKAIDAAIAA